MSRRAAAWLAGLAAIGLTAPALAQSVPFDGTNSAIPNQTGPSTIIWTPSQWRSAFQMKLDVGGDASASEVTVNGVQRTLSTWLGLFPTLNTANTWSALQSFTGISDTGGINTSAPTGYEIGGANALNLSTGPAGQQAVFAGPGAGAYVLANGVQTAYGGVAIGPYAGASMNTSGMEFALAGSYAGQYLTSAYAVTGFGEHVIGYDNSNYATAVGNDSQRDVVGNVNSTSVGAQSQDDGIGSDSTSIGAFSLEGNAGSIIVTGTPTVGDKNCVPLSTTNANVTGLPATACYTTATGDTLFSVATGLANAIAAIGATTPGGGPSPGNGVKLGADAHAIGTTLNVTVRFHFPGGNTTGWAIQPGTPTCTGTCTEVLTVQAPYSGTFHIAIGENALLGYALTSGIGLIGEGFGAFANLQGTNSYGICHGYNCGSGLQTVNSSILEGANVLSQSGTWGYTSANDVMLLTTAFVPTSYTGSKNTFVNTASSVASGTAQGNLAMGYGVTLPSPTGNWQLNIQDALYGGSNNKGGGGGYGWLGAYCTGGNGNAAFTICDAGGSNTSYGAHFGVQQTTAPAVTNATLDATGSDFAGTLTLTAASPAVTFRVAFKTTPHCVVSSPSGTAFTYSASTTALTLTGGANGNTATYICAQ